MSVAPRPVTDADVIAYLDGELDDARVHDVERSLAADPVVAAQTDTWRRQNDMVRAAFGRIAVEPLPTALSGQRRDHGRPVAGPLPPGPAPIRLTVADRSRVQRLRRQRQTRTIAATVMAFVSGGVVAVTASSLISTAPQLLVQTVPLTPPGFPDSARRMALRALETHATFIGRHAPPPDITAADRAKLADLLVDVLHVDADAPDLTREGFKLVGARLTPGEQGPASWVLYQDDSGDRVSLFLTRLVAAESTPRYEEDFRSGTIFWTAAGYGVAVTGPRDRDRLSRIATLVRTALAFAR